MTMKAIFISEVKKRIFISSLLFLRHLHDPTYYNCVCFSTIVENMYTIGKHMLINNWTQIRSNKYTVFENIDTKGVGVAYSEIQFVYKIKC